jgi:hypothetical protein
MKETVHHRRIAAAVRHVLHPRPLVPFTGGSAAAMIAPQKIHYPTLATPLSKERILELADEILNPEE